MLVLVGRGFSGFRLWAQAAANGADLLRQVKTNLRARHQETLVDGSWLATIIPTTGLGRQSTPPLTVRVVDDTIDDGGDTPDAYPLLTTILDPGEASAAELATVDSERGEIESVFDGLKTHQRGPHMVMRSWPSLIIVRSRMTVFRMTTAQGEEGVFVVAGGQSSPLLEAAIVAFAHVPVL